MFLHVSVILFTGGELLSQNALQVVFQHALQQGGGSAPGGEGGLLLGVVWRPPSPESRRLLLRTVLHPTGMHSCLSIGTQEKKIDLSIY